MPLKRLLLGICGVLFITSNLANAQFQLTEANQDGILVLDALGKFYSADANGSGSILFKELENNSQKLGFQSPIVKDVELVGNPDGSAKGAYVVERNGGQFALTVRDKGLPITAPSDQTYISSPAQVGSYSTQFNVPVFFGFDVVEDLEVVPDWTETTFGYKAYFVLDADGVVHTLGNANLPKYVYHQDPNSTDISNATIVTTLFPETIDVSGSNITPAQLAQRGPLNIPMNRLSGSQNVNSATPIFTYFGFGSDIARDLEVSVEYVNVTMPSRSFAGVVDSRVIAKTNGYYILDGFGGVHSSRLPLDFDVNNDGQVLYTDIYNNFEANELNPDFGRPINNAVLAPQWADDADDLPYFGIDVAVDIEITPSGRGFYLLDAYGGVFAVGDAGLSFPPSGTDSNGAPIQSRSTTPFFGAPVARDLALVTNKANESLGLDDNEVTVGFVVLDGFGTVHTAGLAKSYSVTQVGNNGRSISSTSNLYRAIETSPLWLPSAPPVTRFSAGSALVDVAVAPNFRNVTAAFTTISEAQ